MTWLTDLIEKANKGYGALVSHDRIIALGEVVEAAKRTGKCLLGHQNYMEGCKCGIKPLEDAITRLEALGDK